ncbi:HD domain-containing protein [Bacillus thermotolerans]|uniref:HD domain-containing protein n=1 Tax=Bacillus thermotolerans TaxID=1221996 RepID=UPI0005893244|nr:HD domain-containing protein [Bacillus thermotolerans]KKB43819.1 GTP pyrophosphokinase, (p)ppGpp synthetase I [Bacillus thermotolerans]
MTLVEKAITFAAAAHQGQVRKDSNIPYVTHPFTVGMMLQKEGSTEEVIAAGILHDTLEDTEATYEELTKEFGKRVADIVQAVSEKDKSLPWEERKQATIEALPFMTEEALQVIVCDKLHNIRSIRQSAEEAGVNVWERFNRGKKQQHWYYSEVLKKLAPRKAEFKLIEELEREVKQLFAES